MQTLENCCPYNKFVDCTVRVSCGSCSWNPAVHAKRAAAIRKRLEEEAHPKMKNGFPESWEKNDEQQ